jgi:hypothetical protein
LSECRKREAIDVKKAAIGQSAVVHGERGSH